MSFDLKISNGDLSIGNNGDLSVVENTEKLIQDIYKIILTPMGANKSFPGYGTMLKASIGSLQDLQFISSFTSSQIATALATLQKLQTIQASLGQKVTAAETLAALKDVQVQQHPIDPRLYRVSIQAISKALTNVSPTFNVTP